jgi:hypothetical protein
MNFNKDIFVPNNLSLENCANLSYYTVSSCNSLPKFWDKLSVPSTRVKRSAVLIYFMMEA